jgi:hypothetical protein
LERDDGVDEKSQGLMMSLQAQILQHTNKRDKASNKQGQNN